MNQKLLNIYLIFKRIWSGLLVSEEKRILKLIKITKLIVIKLNPKWKIVSSKSWKDFDPCTIVAGVVRKNKKLICIVTRLETYRATNACLSRWPYRKSWVKTKHFVRAKYIKFLHIFVKPSKLIFGLNGIHAVIFSSIKFN